VVAPRLHRARFLDGLVTAVVAGAVMLATPLLLVGPALADSGQATVGDAAEAWYSLAPADACTSPVGCVPVDPPLAAAYPSETLRIAASAGHETARAFVVPALSDLPPDAALTIGTLILPVDPDPASGSVSPEGAPLLACLTTRPVTDGVAGSSAPPPTSDCKTSVQVRYVAGDAPALSIDLEPFLARWAGGAPRYGVAIQAVTDLAADATFAVTLNGRKRAGVPHAKATVAYDVSADAPGAVPPPPPVTPQEPGVVTLPDLQSGGQLPTSAPAAPVVAVPASPSAAPAAVRAPTTAAAFTGYQYPVAFLLPIVLLAALLFLARTFTSDVTPLSFGRT
jgi:hypothetical protein